MKLAEEHYLNNEVRLFSLTGIGSPQEAEQRATATLLSMIKAVSEFGRRITKLCGGPAGTISCFTEVSIPDDFGHKENRPDGLVIVRRGKTEWSCLVEVKVGDNPLKEDQINRYHEFASKYGINAVLTVSSQAALPNGQPPGIKLNGNRLRSIPVTHLSWSRLLSEAQVLSYADDRSGKQSIDDADQAWMMSEWIKYVSAPGSKIIEPPQLGPKWNELVKAARANNIATEAVAAESVARHWDAYLTKFALQFRAKLGVDVEVKMPRKEKVDPVLRIANIKKELLETGSLSGKLGIPNTAGDLNVCVVVGSGAAILSTFVKAPDEGRQQTRINWITRQLIKTNYKHPLKLYVSWFNRTWQTSEMLDKCLKYPKLLLTRDGEAPVEKDLMPTEFKIEEVVKLAKTHGKSNAKILESLSRALESFYGGLLEHLNPHTSKAPELKVP